MFGDHLITTSTEGLQPLGSAAQRSYELVSGTLRDRLSPAHAVLLAEPVAAEHGDQIDWHAPISGHIVRLLDLTASEQKLVRLELAQRISEILEESKILRANPDPSMQRLGEALTNVVEVPSEAMIYVVKTATGLHPVLVHWAWVQDEQTRVRGVLTSMIARPTPIEPATPPRSVWANPIWRWVVLLGWLLLAAVLGLILWLMVYPCGLSPWGPEYCKKEEQALAALYSEQYVIADRILQVEREIALADRRCIAVIPVAPAKEIKPKPEKKGALPIDLNGVSRRFAGLASALYTPLNRTRSGN
ncbi:hypothetical protein DS909_18595 [Phaeobacter gallaeciensis]|uniref:Uncharacterized protein n=2 Tax=Roseobacteraceae TaxID=2854170 RepID=A0A366WSU7_9RHOB|nr:MULTISPECIES: hypothetical protein [Roseobacteraceae]MBT3143074.1 hypothetical protein [Falsiruegeria litorea]MBT8166822.1 hypothetical protein [Falsiruegeria litorea]RBW51599.1 hypothetical protein DS909_18595 [Phaeobacter gallaeciensis]